jgi:hypothetical protein
MPGKPTDSKFSPKGLAAACAAAAKKHPGPLNALPGPIVAYFDEDAIRHRTRYEAAVAAGEDPQKFFGPHPIPQLVQVDLNLVRRLGLLGCTEQEMANTLGVSLNAIQRALKVGEDGTLTPIGRAYKKGLEATRRSLRRQQLLLAIKGNATMCIWLGKQLLGQRDVFAVDHSGKVSTGPRVVTVNIFEPKEVTQALAETPLTLAERVGVDLSPANGDGNGNGNGNGHFHNGNGNGNGNSDTNGN